MTWPMLPKQFSSARISDGKIEFFLKKKGIQVLVWIIFKVGNIK